MNTINYNNRHRLKNGNSRQPAKKHRIGRYFGTLIFGLAAALLIQHFFYIKHVLGHEIKPAKVTQPSATSQQLSTMSSNINAIINNNSDVDIAVSVIDLKTNSQQNYGLQDSFEAASTSKLITACDFLHHVEEGANNLTDTVNDATAQYELQQMIVLSDDDAWQAFNDLLGHPDLQTYADSLGLTNYSADDNTLPASDIALLLQKLYEGQLLNNNDTQLLLGYMAQANFNDYIGPAVPSDVKFYHKTGLLDDRVHDASIIDNGKCPIVLVIFTREDDDQDYQNRAQIMQQITKEVLQAYSIT